MKIKKRRLKEIIKEEVASSLSSYSLAELKDVDFAGIKKNVLAEDFTDEEHEQLKKFIRYEVALIMYDLFVKRSFWINR